jgi:hypothetical protein
LNLRPSGYEPDELPGCSTPRHGIREESFDAGALVRFGGDLLSHVLRRSTIGVAALNGRVRDGIGCFARGCSHQTWQAHARPRRWSRACHETVFPVHRTWSGLPDPWRRRLPSTGSDQAYRAISTGQLSASPRLHLRPIDVVVFHGPQGRPGFEGGFPLRCLQRLSFPHLATLHCRGRDNRSTSGAFTPVLSY